MKLIHRGLIGALGALAFTGALVAPTLAAPAPANSVTQEIIGGTLTASVANASMNSVTYSNSQQITTGALSLTVNDARGSSEGWTVSIQSSDFDYTGSSVTGADIANTGFTITNPNDPSKTDGQAVDATHGPFAIDGGTLDAARTTIGTDSGFGSGVYAQSLDVSLVIPALSQTGTYVATLVVATNAAP